MVLAQQRVTSLSWSHSRQNYSPNINAKYSSQIITLEFLRNCFFYELRGFYRCLLSLVLESRSPDHSFLTPVTAILTAIFKSNCRHEGYDCQAFLVQWGGVTALAIDLLRISFAEYRSCGAYAYLSQSLVHSSYLHRHFSTPWSCHILSSVR